MYTNYIPPIIYGCMTQVITDWLYYFATIRRVDSLDMKIEDVLRLEVLEKVGVKASTISWLVEKLGGKASTILLLLRRPRLGVSALINLLIIFGTVSPFCAIAITFQIVSQLALLELRVKRYIQLQFSATQSRRR